MTPELGDYHDAVQAVLADFQYIEEGLRMYIASSYDVILKKLDRASPFL